MVPNTKCMSLPSTNKMMDAFFLVMLSHEIARLAITKQSTDLFQCHKCFHSRGHNTNFEICAYVILLLLKRTQSPALPVL